MPGLSQSQACLCKQGSKQHIRCRQMACWTCWLTAYEELHQRRTGDVQADVFLALVPELSSGTQEQQAPCLVVRTQMTADGLGQGWLLSSRAILKCSHLHLVLLCIWPTVGTDTSKK